MLCCCFYLKGTSNDVLMGIHTFQRILKTSSPLKEITPLLRVTLLGKVIPYGWPGFPSRKIKHLVVRLITQSDFIVFILEANFLSGFGLEGTRLVGGFNRSMPKIKILSI